MKIIVTGYGRHGKDTFCELLQEMTGMKFASSSMFAAERVIFPALRHKYNYKTVTECFEDRHHHRKEWYDLITEYNTPDPTRLCREVFEQHDVYCGMRNIAELHAVQRANLVDAVIWVDASERRPSEDRLSNTIAPVDCSVVFDNNGTVDRLREGVRDFATKLRVLGMVTG